MDIDIRLFSFDISRTVNRVLFVGFRFYDAPFGNADRNVIGKVDKAIQSVLSILKVEHVDLTVAEFFPHSFPKPPRLLNAKDLLAVNLDAGALQVVLLNELYQFVLPSH